MQSFRTARMASPSNKPTTACAQSPSQKRSRRDLKEYDEAQAKEPDSPPPGIIDAGKAKLLADSQSARSIRQRIPWEKKGILRRFVHLSHIMSFSNVLSFPHLCARYGGVSFLIACIIAHLFVGIPTLCLEMALGQFSSLPPIELFKKMSPSLAGIGVAMLAILMIKCVYYSAIVSQAFFAAALTAFEGIRGPSWADCSFSEASGRCFKYNYTECYALLYNSKQDISKFGMCQQWVEEFDSIYKNKTYWRPPHMDYISANVFRPMYHQNDWSFPPLILPILILVWILTGLLSYIGVSKLGKYFIYLKAVVVFGMMINLIFSISFAPDTGATWTNFFDMNLTSLAELQIWADAVAHVMNSLNLGTGAVHKISSLSDFNENFLYNAVLTSYLDLQLSVIVGFLYISALGSVATRIFPLDEVRHGATFLLTNGYIGPYTMYPEHISWHMPGGWFSASLHYLKIGLVGIPGIVVSLGIVKFAMEEMILKYGRKCTSHRILTDVPLLQRVASVILAIFGFLVSIVLVGSNGFTLSKLWNAFCGLSLMCIVLCELIAISYHYGFRKYLANVQTMLRKTEHKSNMLYMTSAVWYYVFTPFLIIMAIYFKMITSGLSLDYLFPLEFEIYGWTIVVLAFIIIIIPLARYIITFVLRKRSIPHIFDPLPSWGPINTSDYKQNRENEHIFVKI